MEQITLNELKYMNHESLLDLFKNLDPPSVEEMSGEYKALLLDTGSTWKNNLALQGLNSIGVWLGKAFKPLNQYSGYGYNVFQNKNGILRRVRMDTYFGKSQFDSHESYHLKYKKYNYFPLSGMRDEVRKVSDNLYLGIGVLDITLGHMNKFPFYLAGPPEPWIGPDYGV